MLFGLQHPGLLCVGIAGGCSGCGGGGLGGGGLCCGGFSQRSFRGMDSDLMQSMPSIFPDSHHRLLMHCWPSIMVSLMGSQHCVDKKPYGLSLGLQHPPGMGAEVCVLGGGDGGGGGGDGCNTGSVSQRSC